MKWRFNFVLRRSCTKGSWWDGGPSWANIQSSRLATFSIVAPWANVGSSFLSSLWLFTYSWLHHTMKSPWVFKTSCFRTKQMFIRDIWFPSFTIYRIILQIDWKFKSEIFFLPNRFSDHADVTFKSFSQGASASFSSGSSPVTHLWCSRAPKLLRSSFFHHAPYWWTTYSCLFGNFSWS